MKIAAAGVVWEAATKRKVALSLFSSDERSTAGVGLAAAVIAGAGIAATGQVLLLLLLLVWASQQQKEVVVHNRNIIHWPGHLLVDQGPKKNKPLFTSDYSGVRSVIFPP